MKIDTRHKEYDEYLPLWTICRDAAEGQQTVHEKGQAYLPALSGQNDKEYRAYLLRTTFFNATRRTIDGLTGMVFRKYPKTTVPAALEPITKDFTLAQDATESIDLVALHALQEVLTVGSFGILVEYPQSLGVIPTQAQAAALNMRAYVTTYEAEQIINWRYERVNNSSQLVMLALKESVTEWLNVVESKEVEQIRLLQLVDGRYIQQLFRKDARQNWVQFGDDIVPLMNGAPLSFVPFVGMGPCGLGIEPEEPPLIDLVNVNYSHYRTTADLEHGAHFCGLPTAVVTGYQKEDNESFSIGSSTAWVFPAPDADAKYLEFTGQGLGALQTLQEQKAAQMAALGARMLAAEKKQGEAEGTLRMRHAGEAAVLSTVAHTVSEAFTRVLEIIAQWEGVAGDVDFELNTEFYESPMQAQELSALVAAWQAGALSTESMFYNLQRGGVVDPTRTLEDEQESIATQAPSLTPVSDAAPVGNNSLITSLRSRLGL